MDNKIKRDGNPYKKVTSLTLSPKQLDKLKRQAIRAGISKSSWVGAVIDSSKEPRE